MPDMIRDGTGGGYLVEVDDRNRLHSYAVMENESTYVNRIDKEAYSGPWSSSITAATAGNFILYLKNDHSTKDLIILTIKHRCTGANGTISGWLNVTGTPGGSLTTLTPGNRNANSNNTAQCTYYQSTDITGLTNGHKVMGLYGKADEEFVWGAPCSGYIVPPNGTFAIKADNNTSAHLGGIGFYFRDMEI